MEANAVAVRNQAVRDIDSAISRIRRAQDLLRTTRGLGTEQCVDALGGVIAHYRKVRADLMRIS